MTDSGRQIQSRENPGYRALLALAQSGKARRQTRQTLLEGVHLCQAWTARWGPPPQVFASRAALAHPEIAAWLAQHRIAPTVLADGLLAPLTALQPEVALVAVVSTPAPPLPPQLDQDAVYLDRIQDPGNLGTLLRSCAAAGVHTVITAPQTAAAWAPKVMRAAMGAHCALSLHEAVPWSIVRSRTSARVLGTRITEAESLYRLDLRPPCLWIFGNEGQGLSEELCADVGGWVSIPQAPGVESLNVAAAAAVCLFEQRRQRIA